MSLFYLMILIYAAFWGFNFKISLNVRSTQINLKLKFRSRFRLMFLIKLTLSWFSFFSIDAYWLFESFNVMVKRSFIWLNN